MANLSNINNKFLVTTGGNVGIGVTGPDSILQIVNNDSSSYRFGYGGSSDIYLDADDIYFRSDNGGVNNITFKSGNVGIGTTSPSDYYADQLVVKCSSSENGITIVSNSTTDANYLMFADGTSGSDRYRGQIKYNHQDNYMEFATNASNVMKIDSSGNVGIGTVSPTAKLTIDSSISTTYSTTGYAATPANSVLYLNNTHGGSSTASLINFRAGSGDGVLGFVEGGGTNDADFIIQTDGGSNGIERFRILNNGNVGIGVIDPDAKLEVKAADTPATTDYATKVIKAVAPLVGGYTGTKIISLLGGYDGAIHAVDFGYGYNTTGYDIMLSTNDNTTGDPIERMRINSSGNSTFSGTVKSTTFLINLTTAAGIGTTLGDINGAELGPGYLTVSRDDTADAKQISFYKNNVEHSYLETTSSGLNIGNANVYLAKATNQGQLFFGTADNQYEIFGGGTWGYMGYNTSGYHRFLVSGSNRLQLEDGEMKVYSTAGLQVLRLTPDYVQTGRIPIRYPYYRTDSFKTDGSGYFWAFGHEKSDGTQSINMLLNDGASGNKTTRIINNLHICSFASNEVNGAYPTFTTNVVLRNNGDTYFNGGNVGIGTTSPSSKLHISDANDRTQTTSQFRIEGNGYTAFHWLDATAYYINENSNYRSIRLYAGTTGGVELAAGGTSWGTFSDETEKENLKPLENVLDKIKDFRCVEYNLIDDKDSNKKIGFIAQDWENDFSAIVDNSNNVKGEEKLLLRYTETIPVLLKAIQELKAEIDVLKSK